MAWFMSKVNDNLIATGSGDKTIALVDARKLAQPLHILEGHNAEIYMVHQPTTSGAI